MSYRNSVKLLISNFSMVWKQLLYMLIVSLISFGIAYAIFIPTLNILSSSGVISEIGSIFETIYTAPKDFVSAVQTTVAHFSEVISNSFGSIWASILGTIFFAWFVFSMFRYISYYNVTSVMYMKMTSYVDVGYTRNLISNLKPAIRYAFARIVYTIPFLLLKFLIIMLYLRGAKSALSIILGMFLAVTILMLLSSIEISFFVGHAPAMVAKNGNISSFKAFFVGNKQVFKKYHRVLSNSIVISLTLLVTNIFLGVLTVGAALFITLPSSIVLKCIFDEAAYLGVNGERYYISENTIAISNKETEKN